MEPEQQGAAGEFTLLSRNFVFICVATFFYFGSFYLLLPTLPQYVALLGGTPGQVGLVMGFFTLASVVVRPFFGKMTDRRGRKIFMLLGSGFFIVFPVLYSLLSAVTPLYLVRIAHGLAHASFLAASAAYLADLAPPARRGEVLGIYGTSSVVAMALFPAWGAALVESSAGFGRLFTVSAFAAAAGFLAVAATGEIRSRAGQRGRPPGILEVGRRRGVLVPSLALFSGATAYGAVVTFLPLFAPQRGIANFGIFFTVYAVSTILSRVVAGRISDRVGRGKVIVPFMLVLAAAVFTLPFLSSTRLLVLTAILFGFGFGSFMPTLNALVVDFTPPPERGSALAFFTSFMDIGITAGSMALGFIGEGFGYPVMYFLCGAVVLAGLAVFAAFLKPRPELSGGAGEA